MKTLDEQCQAVWNEATIEGKRVCLTRMINSFDHKKKAAKYLEQIQTMRSDKLDKFEVFRSFFLMIEAVDHPCQAYTFAFNSSFVPNSLTLFV
jgi:hypothetical protein